MLNKDVDHPFHNPFQLEDLLILDSAGLCRVVQNYLHKTSVEQFAWALHSASPLVRSHGLACLSPELSDLVLQQWQRCIPRSALEQARRRFLDEAFWELTYWKTPELYEELTIGEYLHPGIFQQLEPYIRGKVVVDAGAGSGRATFEALRSGARLVYAIEPSNGLLRLLRAKREAFPGKERLLPLQGNFAHVPLPDAGVDIALACSAFTAEPLSGGEAGLLELRRVVRPGGVVVVIWPRSRDLAWLQGHGFQHRTLAGCNKMCVHFSSPASARRCLRRFYAGNRSALAHLYCHPDAAVIPFSVLGFNPPCDYCLLPIAE